MGVEWMWLGWVGRDDDVQLKDKGRHGLHACLSRLMALAVPARKAFADRLSTLLVQNSPINFTGRLLTMHLPGDA